MIIAYYTEAEKYLQKDDYRKDFDVDSLEELVSYIKSKEHIVIKAKKQDIFDFKFKSKIDGDFEYVILGDCVSLTDKIIQQDLKELSNGTTDYVKYSVKSELQKILGKHVYLVKDRDLKDKFLEKGSEFVFVIDDIAELVNSLKKSGEISQKVLLKQFFDGREVETSEV